jgi:hypothetical protein
MWPWVSAVMAALGALLALRNMRAPAANAYAHEEYGMTARSHGLFAGLSIIFAGAFVYGAFQPQVPVLALLTVYVLLFVLYATSFARGSSE